MLKELSRNQCFLTSTFVIFILIFTINAAALCHATDTLREPWSTGDDHPVIASNSGTNECAGLMLFGQGETFFNSACFIWLKFYQNCLSMMNTVQCPMEPSCSNYSIQAVKKHGAFKGVVLTADRLLHEIDEQRLAPIINNGNRRKYLDPVENNDFWWYTKP